MADTTTIFSAQSRLIRVSAGQTTTKFSAQSRYAYIRRGQSIGLQETWRRIQVMPTAEPVFETFVQDEQSVLDYSIDWTEMLDAGETITASAWAETPTTGGSDVTLSRQTWTGAVATCFVEGGSTGASYAIENTITTSLGRSYTRGFVLTVDYSEQCLTSPGYDGGSFPIGVGGRGTVTNKNGDLTADMPIFGQGGADVYIGTKSGNTDEVATVSGTLTAGHSAAFDSDGNIVDGGAPVAGGYYQTVQKGGVSQTQRGKLNFIQGSNVTLTVADDSGNASTDVTIASTAGGGTVTHTGGALTADYPMFGAGSSDSKVGTKSGTTDEVATVSGSVTSTHLAVWDSNGNLVDGGVPSSGGTVTNTGGSLTANDPMFGAGGADSKVGTKSGTTNELATVSGSVTGTHLAVWDASGNLIDGGAPAGGGTVTNTGGNLTANDPMFGAGGVDSKVGTKSGNTNQLATVYGTTTSTHLAVWDVSGNLMDGGTVPGSGGFYQVVQKNGTDQPQEQKLDLIEGTGVSLAFVDDGGNNRTKVTIAATGGGNYYQTLQSNGVSQTQEPILDLIEGANVSLTVSDDPTNTRTTVTIASSGGGGGGGVGQIVFPCPTAFSSDSDYQGYSIVACFGAGELVQPATTWKLGFALKAGTLTVGSMVLLRTLPGSPTVIDSTPIKMGGNTSFALAVGENISDDITMPLDYSHSYAVVVYFSSGSGDSIPYSNTREHACNVVSIDLTGITTLGTYNSNWAFFTKALKVS